MRCFNSPKTTRNIVLKQGSPNCKKNSFQTRKKAKNIIQTSQNAPEKEKAQLGSASQEQNSSKFERLKK
jgi:hypothetical protein